MNDCDRFVGRVSDYLEGFLAGSQKKVFESHLTRCPSCQLKVQQMQALRQQLRALPRLKTSADFDTVLRARIGFEKRLKRQGVAGWFAFWPVKVSFYGAATALVVIAAVMVRDQIASPREAEGRKQVPTRSATMYNQPTYMPQVVFPIDAIAPDPVGSIRSQGQRSAVEADIDSADARRQRLNAIERQIQPVHVRM